MCGRYLLRQTLEQIHWDPLNIAHVDKAITDTQHRYNVAPTQTVAAVRAVTDDDARELVGLRWGLVPHWADSPQTRYSMINARAETIDQKPAYKGLVGLGRRCLIAADGFYEWQSKEDGKQPFLIERQDGAVFWFAGLWTRWEGAGAAPIESCAIVVTQPNELVKAIHDRMPVILEHNHIDRWLDPEYNDVSILKSMLKPYPSELMRARPVSSRVNNPKNDDPSVAAAAVDDG